MREILFRGKTDKGEWVVGLPTRKHPFDKKINRIQLLDDYYENDITEFFYVKNVIPETVGQYTGLTDKNGKKIFEGDIVVCKQAINGNWIDYHIEIGFVEMEHGAFGLHRKQGYYRPFKDWLEDYEYEVIGNIHDNPELLKGE